MVKYIKIAVARLQQCTQTYGLTMKFFDFCNSLSDEKKEASPTLPDSAQSTAVNKTTYHARLGLARAIARSDGDMTEAHGYYKKVIEIAPEVSWVSHCINY